MHCVGYCKSNVVFDLTCDEFQSIDCSFLVSLDNEGNLNLIEKLDKQCCNLEAVAKIITDLKRNFKDLINFGISEEPITC